MTGFMSVKNAEKAARKYKVPTPGSGEFVRLPSFEVLHFYLKINQLEIAGWRGGYLQVRPARSAIPEETTGSVKELQA